VDADIGPAEVHIGTHAHFGTGCSMGGAGVRIRVQQVRMRLVLGG